MKNISLFVFIIIASCIFAISGCSSSDDGPGDLITGTWKATYNDGVCDVYKEITLNKDGTFEMEHEDSSCSDDEDNSEMSAEGTWHFDSTILELTFSNINYMSIAESSKFYCFFASSSKMGLSAEDEIFKRSYGTGKNFYGTWVRGDGDCEKVEITNTNTFIWTKTCGGSNIELYNVPFTSSGGEIKVGVVGQPSETFIFKLYGVNKMALIHSTELFSKIR